MKKDPEIIRSIRFPFILWKKLSTEADKNDRTIAKEIVNRLSVSLLLKK